ncbi:hypothetical protein RIF29_21228 [Crotalaria pallida]|uniref:Uncharacterized protein n=1 Tax=Crotalaria pallida TaxID=3830 RepID=A0AAN9F6Z1_CROPI
MNEGRWNLCELRWILDEFLRAAPAAPVVDAYATIEVEDTTLDEARATVDAEPSIASAGAALAEGSDDAEPSIASDDIDITAIAADAAAGVEDKEK